MIRAMPSTPLLVGKGITAPCRSGKVSDEDFVLVRSIFEVCGTVKILQGDRINVAISVNGSGSAYVYPFVKATAESTDRQGIPVDAALHLFSQTLIDNTGMLLHSGHAPDELIKMVSSSGGITLRVLSVFYNRGFETVTDEAILARTHRAEELGE